MPDLPPPPKPRTSGGSTGIVFGILSVILFFPFGPILGPIAISLGVSARREKLRGDEGYGFGIAAIVLGAIGTIVGVGFFVVAAACDCL